MISKHSQFFSGIGEKGAFLSPPLLPIRTPLPPPRAKWWDWQPKFRNIDKKETICGTITLELKRGIVPTQNHSTTLNCENSISLHFTSHTMKHIQTFACPTWLKSGTIFKHGYDIKPDGITCIYLTYEFFKTFWSKNSKKQPSMIFRTTLRYP